MASAEALEPVEDLEERHDSNCMNRGQSGSIRFHEKIHEGTRLRFVANVTRHLRSRKYSGTLHTTYNLGRLTH